MALHMDYQDKKQRFVSSREIGATIKKRRTALRMSQERLAEILEVSYQQIQRYENGQNRLNVENIQCIAAALEVPVTFFFNPQNLKAHDFHPSYLGKEEQDLLSGFQQIDNPLHKSMIREMTRLALSQKNQSPDK